VAKDRNNFSEEFIIYQSGDGKVRIDVHMRSETLWLTQAQMAELFGRSVSVISRHIKNIFTEGELDGKSNLQNMQIPNSDKPSFLQILMQNSRHPLAELCIARITG